MTSTRVTNWLQSWRGRKKKVSKKVSSEQGSSSSLPLGLEGNGTKGEMSSGKKSRVEVEKDEEGSTTEEEEEEVVERPIKRRKEDVAGGGVGAEVGGGVNETNRAVEREEIKVRLVSFSSRIIPSLLGLRSDPKSAHPSLRLLGIFVAQRSHPP